MKISRQQIAAYVSVRISGSSSEEQFSYIKEVIEQSDYYIIISAGRYGSLHPRTGLSYTEMEYDYAVEIGKPIIALLHRAPWTDLPGEKIEQDDGARCKLETFRAKLSHSRLVNHWNDAVELGQKVTLGLIDLQKRRPAVGWVRADEISSLEAREQIAHLSQKVAELKLKNARLPPTAIDVRMIFSHLDGIARIEIAHFCVPHIEDTNRIPIIGKGAFVEIPYSELCVLMCAAMGQQALPWSILVEALRLFLWNSLTDKKDWHDGALYRSHNSNRVLAVALAQIRLNGAATDSPVAGFAPPAHDATGMFLERASFSTERIWSLNDAAVSSSAEVLLEIVGN